MQKKLPFTQRNSSCHEFFIFRLYFVSGSVLSMVTNRAYFKETEWPLQGVSLNINLATYRRNVGIKFFPAENKTFFFAFVLLQSCLKESAGNNVTISSLAVIKHLHNVAAEIKPQIHMVNVLGEKIYADFNYYS